MGVEKALVRKERLVSTMSKWRTHHFVEVCKGQWCNALSHGFKKKILMQIPHII